MANSVFRSSSMLIVLSPAKTLDFETPPTMKRHTLPQFADQSAELVKLLRKMRPAQIAELMQISAPLAELNAARFSAWIPEFTMLNSKQAVLAFDGDVYDGLQAKSFTTPQLTYAQSHLRILSGLYGVLRPLDLMQPYRLEMGTRLRNKRGDSLYAYWGDLLAQALSGELTGQRDRTLVNLASEEYFKAVPRKAVDGNIVTPVFHDWKGGGYKVISFFAKRARGAMARYAILNRIDKATKLKAFDGDGYAFDESASDESTWVFRRRQAA